MSFSGRTGITYDGGEDESYADAQEARGLVQCDGCRAWLEPEQVAGRDVNLVFGACCWEDEPQDRETCDCCGLPVATKQDGEMSVRDTLGSMLCWSTVNVVCSVARDRLARAWREFKACTSGGD